MELSILSSYFSTQIIAVDVTSGRLERFPFDEKTYERRIIVFFDGIHYDGCKKGEVTIFRADDDAVLEEALAIGKDLNQKKSFTNTATFSIQCQHCMQCFTGAKEAQAHGQATGHFNFQQVGGN